LTVEVPGLRYTGRKFRMENSADILRYLYGKFYENEEAERVLRPRKEGTELEDKLDDLADKIRRFFYTNTINVRLEQLIQFLRAIL